MNYYNEIDPFSAQWLRNLIKKGLIPYGYVDERSIVDVKPQDLADYSQCHFFAGIGGWSRALFLADWPETKPVWTGSCPCQPFSSAGRKGGFADERHLWPEWFRLIRECRPPVVFGEQVASKDGLVWLDLVSADLEGEGYAFGAADLAAASVEAPHVRQRLYFVANARREDGSRWSSFKPGRSNTKKAEGECDDFRVGSTASVMGDSQRNGSWRDTGKISGTKEGAQGEMWGIIDGFKSSGAVSIMANHSNYGLQGRVSRRADQEWEIQHRQTGCDGATGGSWRDTEWIYCRDKKWRPIEPCSFPLAHGVSQRVGRLRAYGNAIVPQVAAEFIKAAIGE